MIKLHVPVAIEGNDSIKVSIRNSKSLDREIPFLHRLFNKLVFQ